MHPRAAAFLRSPSGFFAALSLGAALCLGLFPAAAQPLPYVKGAAYDSSIPTIQQVLGHASGDKVTTPADLIRYLRALEGASRRIKVESIGRSWEGRELVFAYIGSEANIARLAEIRAGMQRLGDPRKTSEAEAKTLIADLPAILCLAYSVHGNEISPSDAAIAMAYHMLAAQNDPVVNKIRENVLLIIDPIQNPDGRARWIGNFEQALGLQPDASPISAERDEPWPRGRTNHYLFDLNRDWLTATQPESRARIRQLREWLPQVFVDLHEMGSDSTYYFAPEAVPYNPWLVPHQRTSLDWFGKNNAAYFDRAGFNYFTREVFDAFYPGYGASWPAYLGSIAMTYEQRSSRGLLARTSTGREFTFRDTVEGHFLTSLATAETTADKRGELLTQFYDYRRTAIDEGRKGAVKEYILPREGDVSTIDKLASVLRFHGLEVRRAKAPFRNGTRQYPAGSYVVPLSQPGARMARVLLEKQVAMDDTFLREQDRRRAKSLGDEIYDVTAWSLPLMFNVEAVAAGVASTGDFEEWSEDARPQGQVSPAASPIAYLVPWGTTAAGRFLTAALRSNLTVLGLDKEAVQGGRTYPRGTLVLRVAENPANLVETVARLARESGAEVVAASSGWVDAGINFGSAFSRIIPKANVAMLWDEPTSSNAAGAMRFVLERQFGYPVTIIRAAAVARADLSRYHTLILPPGSASGYARVLGTGGAENLKRFVRDGGTLVGVGGALDYLRGGAVGLLSLKQEREATETPASNEKEAAADKSGKVDGATFSTEKEYLEFIEDSGEETGDVLGVLLRGKVDTDHWLTVGCERGVNVLYSGRTIYAPLTLDEGVNAGYLEAPGKVFESGYLWDRLRKQLAFKPFLVSQAVGRGNVIGFVADPAFRAQMDGNNLLLLNAVFRGPAHSRRAGGD
ncbi:MAG: peptidase M14 [Bryobacterales bacterium]|nr:peptidase M14 [Bryobacterales bacterium]